MPLHSWSWSLEESEKRGPSNPRLLLKTMEKSLLPVSHPGCGGDGREVEKEDSARWRSASGVKNPLKRSAALCPSGESRGVTLLLPQSDTGSSGVWAPDPRSSNTGMSVLLVSENWGGGGMSAGERKSVKTTTGIFDPLSWTSCWSYRCRPAEEAGSGSDRQKEAAVVFLEQHGEGRGLGGTSWVEEEEPPTSLGRHQEPLQRYHPTVGRLVLGGSTTHTRAKMVTPCSPGRPSPPPWAAQREVEVRAALGLNKRGKMRRNLSD